jgi:phage terminase small subunit
MLFAESYLLSLNKAKAAEDAGYSKDTARQQGYEVYNKPEVKAYIESKLTERTISAEETVKLISDTAQASITDYFKPVLRSRSQSIKTPLSGVIKAKNGITSSRDYNSKRIKYCVLKSNWNLIQMLTVSWRPKPILLR